MIRLFELEGLVTDGLISMFKLKALLASKTIKIQLFN